jgi:two-component system CheB/CheR fusion protein
MPSDALDYRLLLEQALGLFLVLEADPPRFTIRDASDEYLRATLTRSDEIVGRGLFEVFPDDPADPRATGARSLRASLERALATRSPDTMAVQRYAVRRPGSGGGAFEERRWSPRNVPVLSAGGDVLCIIHLVEDVTERHASHLDDEEVQEELRREREQALQLARFPEENPDPVFRLSSDLSVLYANRAARSQLELKLGEAAPSSMIDHARYALTDRHAVRTEIPFGDRFHALHFVPVGSEVNVYGHDVTARKRAESRLSRIYESGMIGVLYWTPDGKITDANEKFLEMTGYSREDLASGIDWARMTPPEWRHLDEQALESFEAFGVSPPFEKEYIRKDGSRIPIILGGAMLDETRREGVAFVIDITERKAIEKALRESEEALREADRRKDEFLGMLSHELRNPLAPIRNSLYILSRAAPGGEQARRALAVIDRQVQHTTRLVDDLLDVTRITRGKVRLQRERLDLGSLARRTVEDHRELFAKNGLEVELVVPEDAVFVNADSTRISQVIGNLLQNAVKFTPRGGRATVSVERRDGFGVITVRDTGAGIAREVMPRLFQPFVQAEKTLDRSAGGLGLGLALVRGLVELHGGTVSAHSDGVGKGATFVARLPLERRRAPRLQLVPTGPAPGPRRRVLVIEDNIDSAETLKEALELNDHVVDIALTGPDGLEKARSLKPDVVVCDIGLPGLDGFQVARAIRSDPSLGGVPLIALSGYAQPEDLERSREAGFDLHLAKPPELEALERAIARARDAGKERAAAAVSTPQPGGR